MEKFIFDFHQAELLRDFDQKIIECSICLSTKLGKLCHVISICGHAFCRECLNQFFSTLINDGDVEIKCPECGEIIPPHDVKLYVEPEVFERFDRLLLERGLDGMDDIFYCPQKDCRSRVVKLNLVKLQFTMLKFNFTIPTEGLHAPNTIRKRILRSVGSVDFSFALIVANRHMGADRVKYHPRKLKKRQKFIKKEMICILGFLWHLQNLIHFGTKSLDL